MQITAGETTQVEIDAPVLALGSLAGCIGGADAVGEAGENMEIVAVVDVAGAGAAVGDAVAVEKYAGAEGGRHGLSIRCRGGWCRGS